MDNIVRDFGVFKKYSNLKSIGERISKVYVYKYMTIKTAETCLNNNTFMFSKPPTWRDPYESRFYNAKYYKVEKNAFEKQLFACCVTENKLSEPAWEMYSDDPNEPCVKFSICIGQLRKHLSQWAKKYGIMLYEGRVSYALNDREIDGLHLRSSRFYHSFFDNFGLKEYLNLMLLKRNLFNYEGEIRYMLMGGSLDYSKNHVFIDIPWSMCLSKISIDNQNSGVEKRLKDALEKNYEACMSKFFPLYKPYVPIVVENIYKPFKEIVVEK